MYIFENNCLNHDCLFTFQLLLNKPAKLGVLVYFPMAPIVSIHVKVNVQTELQMLIFPENHCQLGDG